MIASTPSGLFCEAGNFFIDPWEPVERALVTHAHSDHARPGLGELPVRRAGRSRPAPPHPGRASSRRCPTASASRIGDARVSFHPAGHILGSAQIRVEHRGEVWVVSGDYKRQAGSDLRPVRAGARATRSSPRRRSRCRSTRGIRRRPSIDEILAWWRANRDEGRPSVAVLLRARQGAADPRRAGATRRTARSTCTAPWRR